MPLLRHRPMLAFLERTLETLEHWHLRFGSGGATAAAQRTGMQGERAAYFYLRRAGYTVVARRWRHAMLDGEVDLIAWEGEALCFVEVKTRSSRTPFAAEFSVDESKAEALHRMAEAYVRQMPWPTDTPPTIAVRFDVVSVYLAPEGDPDIRLLRDFLR